MKKMINSLKLSIPFVVTLLFNNILAQECRFFLEKSGELVIEAENYCQKIDKFPTEGSQKLEHAWTPQTNRPGYSGTGFLSNLPDEQCENKRRCTEHNSPKNGSGPELIYNVRIKEAGDYQVWVRGLSLGGESNGVHVQFDGVFRRGRPGTNMSGFRPHRQWVWEKNHKPNSRPPIINLTAGDHTLHVYGRDDGFSFDKILLRKGTARPTGLGPAESLKAGMPVASNLVEVKGELKQWHNITLEIKGPQAKEGDSPNPFLDYKLTGIFEKDGKRFEVPGYFAADGDAANTSASEGNIWRIHFNPNQIGDWKYTVRFRSGTNVAVDNSITAGTEVMDLDNLSGVFTIENSDKSGKDFRGQGRLEYVGEHYMKFSGSGKYFLKGGVDSPENFLAYEDFDGTFDGPNTVDDKVHPFLHKYGAHLNDWKTGNPVWKGNKGKSIIGALNYLEEQDLNSIYFLTQNVNGDGDDVWPWTSYDKFRDYDCSKLDQWGIVFEYAQKLGIMLQVVHQERENDDLLNGGDLGIERKLYYRELIARYGHHNALVWNLGEENKLSPGRVNAITQYVKESDPYKHLVVMHTVPTAKERFYSRLLGNNFFDGTSFQHATHAEVIDWIDRSAAAGRKWVCNADEQPTADLGLVPDSDDPDHDEKRELDLWSPYMAGAAGVEWYFGSENKVSPNLKATSNRDRTLEDFTTRENMYKQTKIAREFFETYLPFHEMKHSDDLVTNSNWCFSKKGEVYVVYLRQGGTTRLDLEGNTGDYSVQWFNPRVGGPLLNGTITDINGGGKQSLGLPPNTTNRDWTVLIRNKTTLSIPTTSFNLDSKIKIVPNPALDYVNIEGEFKGEWILYNMLGQQIIKGTGKKIKTSDLSSGLYHLKIDNSTYRLIKE